MKTKTEEEAHETPSGIVLIPKGMSVAEFNAKKQKQIVQEASNAFWDVVAKANPTIKTGDFGIEETQEWNNNCEKAVSHWIEMNTYSIR